MIFDKLENYGLYEGLGERFVKAFSYLRNLDIDSMKEGRNFIDGDNVYAIKVVSPGLGKDGCCYENHRKYIDMQYTCSGTDLMGVKIFNESDAGPEYDEEKDVTLYPDMKGGSWMSSPAGCFSIFFPDDCHAPLACDEPVVKVVVKIRVD